MFELFIALGLGVASVLGVLYLIVRQDKYIDDFKRYYDDDSGGIVH